MGLLLLFGGGVTAVGKSCVLPSTVAEGVGKSCSQPYVVRGAAGVPLALPYLLRAEAGKSCALPYLLRTTAGKSCALPSQLRTVVGTSLGLPYDLGGTTGKSLVQPWSTGGAAGKSCSAPYVIRATVGVSLELPYSMAGTTGKSLVLPYGFITEVGASLALAYHVRTAVGRRLVVHYFTGSADLVLELEHGVEPDFEGFELAQRRQHALFDGDIVFLIPTDVGDLTFPANTSLDPETGQPIDPTIEPTTGGTPTEIRVKGAVAGQRTGAADIDASVAGSALGTVESGNCMVILQPEVKPLVEDATECEIWDKRWRITEWRPDGLRANADRWLVFVEEK